MNWKAFSFLSNKSHIHLISLADLTQIIQKEEVYWIFMVIDRLGYQVDTDLTSGLSYRKLEKVSW